MGWMAHRKWKESKQQPSMLPVPGCCSISFHFLWAIHPIRPVQQYKMKTKMKSLDDQAPMKNSAQIAFQENFESALPPSPFHAPLTDRPTEGQGAKRRRDHLEASN